ncbi:hypothetical protein K1719_019809 [Acacia pycnantha]|nr:hypothetical protein K1719_019809 [Acacia pycnantha]
MRWKIPVDTNLASTHCKYESCDPKYHRPFNISRPAAQPVRPIHVSQFSLVPSTGTCLHHLSTFHSIHSLRDSSTSFQQQQTRYMFWGDPCGSDVASIDGSEYKWRRLVDFLKMADQENKQQNTSELETQDRGLFDFIGKKDGENKAEHHLDQEQDKKPGLLEKLHRSNSSSSSSSDEEEVGEDGEKRKKKKEEKKKEEAAAVTVTAEGEEKKGLLDKIKEKLPGQHKKTEEVPPPAAAAEPVVPNGEDGGQKKGILEKIKEKLPGHQPKTTTTDPYDKEH